METPLVPNELSGKTRTGLNVAVILIGAFVLATIALCVAYGVGPYHGGYIIIGISIAILLACTGMLLNWMKQDKLEDKVKYVTIAQSLALVVTCASIIAVMYGPQAPAQYSIGGSVVGGSGLVIKDNNSGAKVTITTNDVTGFFFPDEVDDGTSFSLGFETLPASSNCVFLPNSGTLRGQVNGKDYLNVRVKCTAQYVLGGTVTGLVAGDGKGSGVTLTNIISGEQVTVEYSADAGKDGVPFSFATRLTTCDKYDVEVTQNPTNQKCTISGTAAGTAYSDVQLSVNCS